MVSSCAHLPWMTLVCRFRPCVSTAVHTCVAARTRIQSGGARLHAVNSGPAMSSKAESASSWEPKTL